MRTRYRSTVKLRSRSPKFQQIYSRPGPDSCNATSSIQFDHIVGAGKQHRRSGMPLACCPLRRSRPCPRPDPRRRQQHDERRPHSIIWVLPALVALLALPALVAQLAPLTQLAPVTLPALVALLALVVLLALVTPPAPLIPGRRSFGPWPFSYRCPR
jgi:hypothetical protein